MYKKAHNPGVCSAFPATVGIVLEISWTTALYHLLIWQYSRCSTFCSVEPINVSFAPCILQLNTIGSHDRRRPVIVDSSNLILMSVWENHRFLLTLSALYLCCHRSKIWRGNCIHIPYCIFYFTVQKTPLDFWNSGNCTLDSANLLTLVF